jgi:hypothetical protein
VKDTTPTKLWALAIFGTTYWAVSEALAGRWSWRRVDLRRALALLLDSRQRARRERGD